MIHLSKQDKHRVSVLNEERERLQARLGELRDTYLEQEARLRESLKENREQLQTIVQTGSEAYLPEGADPANWHFDLQAMAYRPLYERCGSKSAIESSPPESAKTT